MRIGISCYPTYGGSGIVATELAMALAERRRRGPRHQLRPALAPDAHSDPRIFFHEVVVPRYPLFEYPPYSLALATKMVEVARHKQPRPAPRPLRDAERGLGGAGAADRRAAAAAGRHHPPRHRHHPGRQRSQLPRDHPLGDRAERRGDGGLRGRCAAPPVEQLRHPQPHRRGAELHRPGALRAGQGLARRPPLGRSRASACSSTSRTSGRSSGCSTWSRSSAASTAGCPSA